MNIHIDYQIDCILICYGVSTRHCQESVCMSSVMSVILDVVKSLKIAKQVTTFQFVT